MYVHSYIAFSKTLKHFLIIKHKKSDNKLFEYLEEAGDQELSVCAFVVNSKLCFIEKNRKAVFWKKPIKPEVLFQLIKMQLYRITKI